MNKHDKTEKDDVVFDSSEFESNKKAKKPAEDASDVESISDEDSRELSPEAFKKLKNKLSKALAEKQEYLDGWQRAKADFVNFKKRSEEERKDLIKYASLGIVEELIPVLESFTMAFANKEAWEKADKNWRIGVEYIYNQLLKTLQDNGLKEVNPLGEKFDPARDEAVEYVPVDDKSKDGKVIAVISKGYSLGEKIIRPPKVKVGESGNEKKS